MTTESDLRQWLETNCPNIWNALNKRARAHLPLGLGQSLPEEGADVGKHQLQLTDKRFGDLIRKCGQKEVGDAYRRRLSTVRDEQQLSELLCEATVCAALANVATAVCLQPRVKGQGTHPEGRFDVAGYALYVEVKRYEDEGPTPIGRSVSRSPVGTPTPDTSRARMMDLMSKLKDVPSQLANGELNVLFVFHQSLGDSHRYLQQALFGDDTFFDDPHDVCVTGSDALFGLEAWKKISAVTLVTVGSDGKVRNLALWRNPSAAVPLPDSVRDVILHLE